MKRTFQEMTEFSYFQRNPLWISGRFWMRNLPCHHIFWISETVGNSESGFTAERGLLAMNYMLHVIDIHIYTYIICIHIYILGGTILLPLLSPILPSELWKRSLVKVMRMKSSFRKESRDLPTFGGWNERKNWKRYQKAAGMKVEGSRTGYMS